MCARFAIWSWLNLEGQRLPDRRAAGARRKGLDMNEDILAATIWFTGIGPLQPWVASPAAPTPAAPTAMSPSTPWLTTEDLCAQLAISRSTLFAIKRSGLLKPGRHLVLKNPGCRRSHLLWHLHRCELALGRQP